jgi:hypothetical protein
MVALVALMFVATGCRSYTVSEVPITEPNDKSYCQRIDDMAVGIEPYMVQDKTHYVFNEDLWDEQVLALNISMLSDGGKTYTVKRAGISATDEFGNEYAPMAAEAAAERIRARGQGDSVTANGMPDEVTVTADVAQGFVYFDMMPNNVTARQLTVYLFADGESDKSFSITVDPYRMHMNPTERWASYHGGVVKCDDLAKIDDEMDIDRAEQAAKEAQEAAERAEKAADKQERIYEKQLTK